MSDFIEKCIGMFIVLILSCFSVVAVAFIVTATIKIVKAAFFQ